MIVDTSVVLAAVERRSQAAADAVAAMAEPSIRSMVVLGELHFGVESLSPQADPAIRARREASLEYYLLISAVRPSPSAGRLGSAFGRISAVAQHAGLRIGQNDRSILAEALRCEVPVLTCDSGMHVLGELVSERLGEELGQPITLLVDLVAGRPPRP